MTAAPETDVGPGTAYTLTHRQIQVVFAGLMAGSFLAAMDQTVVATALPTIVGDFGGVDQLAWVASIYLLTSTAAMPLVGKLSDLYGRRLLFQLSIAVFMLGSLLAGLSQSMGQLIACRALQGLGAGGLIVLNFAIIADVVAPRERGRYQGYVASVWALASVVGPLLGGFFVDELSWRWVFFVNVPIGIGALLITNRALQFPRAQIEVPPIDYLGAALLIASITCLLLATEWGGSQYPWGSAEIVGLLGVAVVVAVLFVVRERHVPDPILPLGLFRIPTFRVSSVAAVVFGTVMFGSILFVPVYFQIVRGDTATSSGLLLIPQMAGILTGTISCGRLVTRTGRYKYFPVAGLCVLAVGYGLLARVGVGTSPAYAMGCMVLVGLGMGFTTPVLMLSVQNAVPTATIGAATSAMTTLRSMGAAIGAAIFGAVLSNRLDAELAQRLGDAARRFDAETLRGSPGQIARLPTGIRADVVDSFAHALDAVFLVAVPIVLLALAVVLFLPELPLRTRAEMVSVEPEPVF